MKLSYPISLLAAVALFTATSASAQDNTTSLKEDFFPTGSVTPQMAEAIEAIPFGPARPSLPGAQKAPAYDEGMSGPWRPSVVTSYTDKGANLFKYIYYYDNQGRFYSKDQSQVRVYQSWNATDGVWENKMRFKLIFDENNDIVEAFTDTGFKQQWNNWYRIFYTYDSDHNMLTAEQQSWYEDGWYSTLKWENTYDEKGNLLTQTYYNRPLGSSEWTRGSQHTWQYDETGRITFYDLSHWSEASQKYSPYITDEYVFDESGNLLTQKHSQNSTPSYIYTYTYNDKNNKVTFLHQTWKENDWANYMFIDYIYDEQDRESQQISKLWNGGEWELNRKTVFQYFAQAESQTLSQYDSENDKWQEQSRVVRRYDQDGHLICISNDEWSDVFNFLKTQTQELFTYENGLLVSQKMQDWNSVDNKFDDIKDYSFTYNEDRNCNNVTASVKQSKDWIIAPYNNMADEWGCPDYDPWIGDLEYLNITNYVEPTGITLDAEEVTLEPDFSKQLAATVAPENVSNPEFYWTSSDETVARVNVNGRVYALAKGEATITATTMDNRFSAQCKVKVGETGISETVAEGSFAYRDGEILFTPANERHSISVYDISGKAVCHNDARTAISTSEWAPGLYIVKTTDGSAVKAYKIIVK